MRYLSATVTSPSWAKRVLLLLLPFVIVGLALGLRLQGVDWDDGNFYHPDERSIYMRADVMYRTLTDAPGWELSANPDFPLDTPGFPSVGTLLDKDTSPLNPHWFPLGTIILYMLVGVRFLLEPFMDQVRLQDLASAGRIMAAIADAGSVLVMYYLGSRLFGRSVGLLSSVLLALSVINIQVTHFYRPESFVILLVLASFWWMLNVLERGRLRDHLLLGFIIGVTFAFRASSLPILAPLAITYGALLWPRVPLPLSTRPTMAAAAAVVRQGIYAGAVSLVTFTVLQPYALLDFGRFIGDLSWEAGIARTAGNVPYTLQYVDTPRTGLYELRQTSLWALGLPLGIVAWGGLALTAIAMFVRPRLSDWLLVAWVAALLFTVVPFFEVKFLRYVVPVLPIVVLLGSRWLMEGYRWSASRQIGMEGAAMTAIAVVVASTGFYALAFVNIYNQDHPGVQASDWINANAPAGARVLTDNHWDEGFPNLGRFNVAQIPIYEADTLGKIDRLAAQIAGADYIMAYSNRPWGSVLRVPDRYPFSSAYYRALFSGELGYAFAQGFTRYPSLAGVSFVHDPFTRAGLDRPESLAGVDDGTLTLELGWADENVANYDRPLVLIWQNAGRMPASEIRKLMLSAELVAEPERALLSAEAAATQRAGGTWTDIFNEGGLNDVAPWLTWLLFIEIVFLVSLPLSFRLMRWLPDRGVVLARPLGLLVISWLVWMGASTGLWEFNRLTILLSLGILTVVSGVLLYQGRSIMRRLARMHWRYLVGTEVLFLLAFFVFLAIRAANPDLWHPFRGGEKPMDFSYLTAVVKSTTFPPFDPWYAGGSLNYYYYGFVIVGSMMKVTGIVPAIANNLAVPTLFALTLTGAFSVGYNLTESLRRRMKLGPSVRSTVLAGLATALVMVVLANVDGAVQQVQGAWRAYQGEHFGTFDFWRSSRMMPGQISINEFPFWTFLFADLHAHLISLPFQVLAVGLAVNVALSSSAPISMLRRAPELTAMAFVVGSLAAINTWDVPAYGVLSLAAIAIVVVVPQARLHIKLLGKWLLWAALFWAVLYALWLPFHQNYDAPFAGVKLSQWRTVFWHYLGIHALLIFVVGTWLAVGGYRRLAAFRARPARMFTDLTGSPSRQPRWFDIALVVVPIGVVVALWVVIPGLKDWTTLTVLALFVMTAVAMGLWWMVHREVDHSPVHLIVLAMAVLGLGVGIGVDIVTAEHDIDRMNTVFKFYLNAWVLLSIVAGVGLWHLWATGTLRLGGKSRWRHLSRGWVLGLALLVLASAVYPVLGTRARLADRFDTNLPLTLDGEAFQGTAVYHDPGPGNRGEEPNARYELRYDDEAIDFLRQNIIGSPVFLEGVTDQYRWTPRVSRLAGLPVVVGWEWHQLQQRGASGQEPANVRARILDVRTMYGSTDAARFMSMARGYGVEYIYVGAAEHLYFPAAGLAKFETMVGTELDVYYENPGVTVYRVLPSAA
jgi:YYY domain-containing protein